MTAPLRTDVKLPDASVALLAGEAARRLSMFVGVDRLELRPPGAAPGDPPVVLPAMAVGFLAQVLAALSTGGTPTVETIPAELTAHEAATLLNISTAYVVGLLEDGELPSHTVDGQRRVRLADLVEYDRRVRTSAQAAMDEMTADAQAMGFYDPVTPFAE